MSELKPSDIERTKLTANLFNTIAAGIVLAAFVVPLVGLSLGTVQPIGGVWTMVGISLFGLMLAAVPHLGARRLLRRLDG